MAAFLAPGKRSLTSSPITSSLGCAHAAHERVELAIAVRNSSSSAKILLFSDRPAISDILASGKQRGFTFDVIAKPIHPLQLLQQLKEL